MSRLAWFPDPRDPLTIWAVRVEAVANYRIDWGDGTSTPMAGRSRPTCHTYTAPGRYILAVDGGDPDVSEAVMRGTIPAPTFTLLHHRTLRVTLPAQHEPVHYKIDWGDGTITEHGSDDLEPLHTYPIGYAQPTISVTDEPARTTRSYTAPTMPVTPTTVFRPLEDQSGGARIDLAGFPPGVTVTMHNITQDTSAVAIGEDGTGTFDIKVWASPDRDWWKAARFAWTDPDSGEPRQHVQHARICEWSPGQYGRCACYQNDFPITLDWDDEKPYLITATAAPSAPLAPGEYRIDWGDEVATRHIVGAEGRLDAIHDYRRNREAWIHISGPAGIARRFVGPLKYYGIVRAEDGPVLWWTFGEYPGAEGADPYQPVRIDPGDGRWPIIETLAPRHDRAQHVGTGWNYVESGHYTFIVSAPMTDQFSLSMNMQGTEDAEEGPYDWSVIPENQSVIWQFWPVEVTEGTYTGRFSLYNTLDVDLVNWEIEFDLDPDETEVVTDASPHTVIETATGRWRITGASPIQPHTSIDVFFTVRPATKPPVFPINVRTIPPSWPLA